MKKYLLLLLGLSVSASALYADPQPLKITIVNKRTKTDSSKIFVIPNAPLYDINKNVVLDTSAAVPLTSTKFTNTGNQYSITIANGLTSDTINNNAKRLYFSLNTPLPGGSGTISFSPATAGNIRYDFVEFTADGSSSACIDLSSVDQIGLCLSITSKLSGQVVSTVGWKKGFTEVFNAIKAIKPDAALSSGGNPVRAVSPSSSPTIWKNSNMLNAANGNTIKIRASFEGTIYDVAASLLLSGKINIVNGMVNINLKGTSTSSGVTQTAEMDVKNLDMKSLYQAQFDDKCSVTLKLGGNPVTWVKNQNDRWMLVFNYLACGFNQGFWSNPKTLDTFTWNCGNIFTGNGNADSYNQYSSIVFHNSDSYGDPFSDNVPGNHVQLNIDPNKVDELVITIYDDDKFGGYTPHSSQLQGMQVSAAQTTPSLTTVYFNDSKDSVTKISGSLIGNIPSNVIGNQLNKLSFAWTYPAGSKASPKYDSSCAIDKLPYILVYIPGYPFIKAKQLQKINLLTDCSKWKSLGGGSHDYISWSFSANPNIPLTIATTANLIPSNWVGTKPKPDPSKVGVSVGVQFPSNSGISGFLVGTTKFSASSGVATLKLPEKKYSKLTIQFGSSSGYIWINPTTGKIDCKGWTLPNSKLSTGMFSFSNNILILSGDVIPANWNSKNADSAPPTSTKGSI